MKFLYIGHLLQIFLNTYSQVINAEITLQYEAGLLICIIVKQNKTKMANTGKMHV